MLTAKIKRVNYDANDTFQALRPYVVYGQDGLTIRDNDLYYKLDQASKNIETIADLKKENTELKEKQVVMSALVVERNELKEQLLEETSKPLPEYQGQIDQYKSGINQLKTQGDKQLSQIRDLNDKIKSLEKDNQDMKKNNKVLQDSKKDIESSKKELQDSLQEKEDIKEIFNKWGTYTSLKKDIQIIQFFMSRPGKEIRQKTIINTFRTWDKSTCRNHLYGLLKKNILDESSQFKGSYRLNPDGFRGMVVDVDEIASLILGENLYEMAVDQHQQKNEQSED